MAEGAMNFLQRELHKRMPLIAKLLAVGLILMLILFFLQWYLITKLFSFAADLMMVWKRQKSQRHSYMSGK